MASADPTRLAQAIAAALRHGVDSALIRKAAEQELQAAVASADPARLAQALAAARQHGASAATLAQAQEEGEQVVQYGLAIAVTGYTDEAGYTIRSVLAGSPTPSRAQHLTTDFEQLQLQIQPELGVELSIPKQSAGFWSCCSSSAYRRGLDVAPLLQAYLREAAAAAKRQGGGPPALAAFLNLPATAAQRLPELERRLANAKAAYAQAEARGAYASAGTDLASLQRQAQQLRQKLEAAAARQDYRQAGRLQDELEPVEAALRATEKKQQALRKPITQPRERRKRRGAM